MKLSLWIFIRDVILNESKWSLESGVAYEFLDFAEAADSGQRRRCISLQVAT